MYVYTPVFLTALWMLMKGDMDPARNPRFKASSEAYGGGFPPMAWINVGAVTFAWALLSVDIYVAWRDAAAEGMQFSIAAEGLMVAWITWAMGPVFWELPVALGLRKETLEAQSHENRDAPFGGV
jgi:hypothetical protein